MRDASFAGNPRYLSASHIWLSMLMRPQTVNVNNSRPVDKTLFASFRRAAFATAIAAALVPIAFTPTRSDAQEAGRTAAQTVGALAAVSSPLDLAAAGAAIDRGFNRWVYARMFLRTMLRKAEAKWRQFPGLFDLEAVRRAEVVRRLVLCAGGPALDAQAVDDWVAPRLRALEALDAGGSMEQLAQTLVPQFIGTGALPEGVRLASHALGQVYPGAYRRALEALSTFDRGASALAQLAIPALLVGGELDRCTPPAALEALAQVMPDAQTVLLPHIGHWPQLEDPEGFDAALLDFLAQRRVLH